jgi:hypothetical protein
MRSETQVIHDGSRCIGLVVEVRASRFAAYDPRKQCLGEFPNMQGCGGCDRCCGQVPEPRR